MSQNPIFLENIKKLSDKELYYGPILEDYTDNKYMQENDKDAVGLSGIETCNLSTSIILLSNISDMELIDELEKRSNIYNEISSSKMEGVPMLPFYLYYDFPHFSYLIQKVDIGLLCMRYRIVVIVGIESFYNFFQKIDVLKPNIIRGIDQNNITKIIEDLWMEKEERLYSYIKELKEYYHNNYNIIRQRIKQGQANICVLKNYYEPVKWKQFYQCLKGSLRNSKYNVTICNEKGPVFRTPEIYNLFLYKPDIVLQINKSRDGRFFQGEPVYLEEFRDLIFINWLQDFYPDFLDENYARSLCKNDFIYACYEKSALDEYSFPASNLIYNSILPADEKQFCIHDISDAEHKKYDCDISFAGMIMNEKQIIEYIFQTLSTLLSYENITDIVDEIFDMIENMYDGCSDSYIVGSENLKKHLSNIQKKFKVTIKVKMQIYRVLLVVEYNCFRKFILKQIADQKKYKILYYGATDLQIEGLIFGGYLCNPGELSKAMQCSRLTLQINPTATGSQRIAESLLTHTPVLIFKMKNDMYNISHYLKETEGICYFQNKKELLSQCNKLLNNENWRIEIAEKGYKKASSILSFDHMFLSLIEQINNKLI